MTDRPGCPVCGSTGYVDLMALGQPDPVLRICDRCGLSSRPVPVFRQWRGSRVDMIDPSWQPDVAAVYIDGAWRTPNAEPPVLTVWCGPPAPYPAPPTPEEILCVAAWLTAPGPGRADLSEFRVYCWEAA